MNQLITVRPRSPARHLARRLERILTPLKPT